MPVVAPVMMKDADVKRLIKLMNNPKEVVNLVRQMDGMERQLAKALDDLDFIKKELSALKVRPKPKQEYLAAMDYVGSGIEKAKALFSSAKTAFMDNVKKALEAAKTTGAAGIEKALNLMGVKDSLLRSQERIDRSIQAADKSIDKLHALGGEYHAIGYHISRVIKTIADKEISGGIKGNGKINDFLKAPFKFAKNRLLIAGANCKNGLDMISRIEQTAQRGRDAKAGSIKDQLDSFQPTAPKAATKGKDLAYER